MYYFFRPKKFRNRFRVRPFLFFNSAFGRWRIYRKSTPALCAKIPNRHVQPLPQPFEIVYLFDFIWRRGSIRIQSLRNDEILIVFTAEKSNTSCGCEKYWVACSAWSRFWWRNVLKSKLTWKSLAYLPRSYARTQRQVESGRAGVSIWVAYLAFAYVRHWTAWNIHHKHCIFICPALGLQFIVSSLWIARIFP